MLENRLVNEFELDTHPWSTHHDEAFLENKPLC